MIDSDCTLEYLSPELLSFEFNSSKVPFKSKKITVSILPVRFISKLN